MTLTDEQYRAFQAIQGWLRSPAPEFLLSGYAGTGKTTLVAYLIQELGLSPMICAPTAKATAVLRRKLTDPKLRVGTIHSFLYQPKSSAAGHQLQRLEAQLAGLDPSSEEAAKLHRRIGVERRKMLRGNPTFELKSMESEQVQELVIVDEASMVTRQMRMDLNGAARKILYVGDGAQLPPIGASFFHSEVPDVQLVEIQRQALESPIIRLSMRIRSGDVPHRYDEPDCRIVERRSVSTDEYMAADQVLIGTNKGRRKLNRFARERRFGPAWAQSYLLMPDEKLICKQNAVAVDHKLINGNLFRVISESPQSPWRHATQRPYTPVDEPTATPLLSLQDSPEEWSYAEIFVGGLLENYYPDYEHIAPHIMMSAQARYNLGCLDFDYGYAITVHASQGSEWDHVVVCDDWEGRDRLQWLYTAVTRAKQKLIWVR